MHAHRVAVLRRNVALMAAGIMLTIAFVVCPEALFSLTTGTGWWILLCTVLAGLFGALGIRELGRQRLPGPGEPWYIRPGTWLFLPVATFCVLVLGGLSYEAAVWITGLEPVPTDGVALEFLAALLFWTPVLDWPREMPLQRPPHSRSWRPPAGFVTRDYGEEEQ